MAVTPVSPGGGGGGAITLLGVPAARPSVSAVVPGDATVGISTLVSIKVDVSLPNVGAGVSEASVKAPGNVTLVRIRDGVTVPSNANTTGGGDAIILTPTSPLEPNTQYRFTITENVTDTSGARFTAFTSAFTTGNTSAAADPTIRFNKTELPLTFGYQWTTVAIGPDGRLYAGTRTGQIVRFILNPDGTVGGSKTIQSVRTAHGNTERLITGIVFDPASTKTNPILWVSHGINVLSGAANWSGKISKLTGRELQTYTEMIYNLPRSAQDHLTNQLTFGPDGLLYVAQGSMSAQGAPDSQWGLRDETRLSAAILQINPAKIVAPLNVKTQDAGGPYNPFKKGNPVRLYATGVRNAYDLLWTRDGKLYAPTNGSAKNGNSPAGDGAPALTGIPTQNDFLYQVSEGGYYGHPNPSRGEFVLNGGNPTAGTDEAEISLYPVGTQPADNYRGVAYDFGRNVSPNGVIEFSSSNKVLGGALNGKMLVAQFSAGDNIIVLSRDAAGKITKGEVGFAGLTQFVDPLDLVQHPTTGYVYVAEYGAGRITLLTPDNSKLLSGRRVRTDKEQLVFNDVRGGGVGSPTQSLTIRNRGLRALTIDTLELTGGAASMFSLVNAPNRPFDLQPGQYVTITLNFTPPVTTSNGVKATTLRIVSNDTAGDATKDIVIRGIATNGLEGENEPSFQRILDGWRIPITVGDDDLAEADMPNPPLTPNDEISAQKFVKAGTGNVTIEPIAMFAPNFAAFVGGVGYYNTSSGTTTQVFSVNENSHQTVDPKIAGWDQFDPGSGEFGIYTLFPQRNNRIAYTQDARNTWDTGNGHKVRVYPFKRPDGSTEPNAYVLGFEAISTPTDHQDIVLVVKNVQPVGGTSNRTVTATTSAPAKIVHPPRVFGEVFIGPNRLEDSA